jgi:hypothetical protein
MKTLTIILVSAFAFVNAQEKVKLNFNDPHGNTAYVSLEALQGVGVYRIGEGTNTDSLEAICKERGHVRSNYCSMTLLANIPRYVDLPDRTLRIKHDSNMVTYRCQRCGKGFSEPVQAEPDTVIIWKK